jgi:hypothetical protein
LEGFFLATGYRAARRFRLFLEPLLRSSVLIDAYG